MALKQQVASRLAEHRQRRMRSADLQPELPMQDLHAPRNRRVADSVAARFAKSVSYREFLQHEAETAMRQAEAAAEVAHRTAIAVAAAQQQLLDEIDQWNASPVSTSAADVLPFAPLAEAAVAAEPAPVAESVFAAGTLFSATPVFRSEPVYAAPTAAPLKPAFIMPVEPQEPAVPIPANLIEFPRQLVAARRARPRFAEGPLRDEADASPERAQLRIFEVETDSISTTPTLESALPEWHTIRLDASETSHAAAGTDAQASFALPLFVAPVSSRLMAAAVDTCCISVAFLAGITAAAYASVDLPTGVAAAVSAVASLCLFGLLYQVMFFWLSGATLGMRYARIGMCTFADENPSRGAMLRRVFALLLATLPLGLGVIWAAMDEEGLGWHDRISRMYLRAY